MTDVEAAASGDERSWPDGTIEFFTALAMRSFTNPGKPSSSAYVSKPKIDPAWHSESWAARQCERLPGGVGTSAEERRHGWKWSAFAGNVSGMTQPIGAGLNCSLTPLQGFQRLVGSVLPEQSRYQSGLFRGRDDNPNLHGRWFAIGENPAG